MPNFRKEPNLILLSVSEFGVQFPSVIPNRMHWLGGTQTQRDRYWHKQLIWALDDNSANVAKAVSDLVQQVSLLCCPPHPLSAGWHSSAHHRLGQLECARLTHDELLIILDIFSLVVDKWPGSSVIVGYWPRVGWPRALHRLAACWAPLTITATDLDERISAQVTNRTAPETLLFIIIQNCHHFFVISPPKTPLVLGYPWFLSITHRFLGYRAMWWVEATTDILSASGLPCLLVVVQSFWVTTPWPCIDCG